MKKFLTLLLSVVFISADIFAVTDAVWCAVTDTGERVKLESIDCLIAVDGADRFALLLKSGTPVENVRYISFEQMLLTSLTTVGDDGDALLGSVVGGELTVTALRPIVRLDILSAEGRVIMSRKVSGASSLTIDVTSLLPGCYVLSTGTSSIKFIKTQN